MTMVAGTFLVFLTVVRNRWVDTSHFVRNPCVACTLPRFRYSILTLASTPSELLNCSPGETRSMEVVEIKLLSARAHTHKKTKSGTGRHGKAGILRAWARQSIRRCGTVRSHKQSTRRNRDVPAKTHTLLLGSSV